jgi:hypothetical protein
MLDEYYRLHGWDKNGVPKKETIRRLGLPLYPPLEKGRCEKIKRVGRAEISPKF